jgi:uncharacterized UPF0160 family protein
MKIVTHNGHFHADELLAIAALLLKYPPAEIVRSRDQEIIHSGDIVVDVGHVYDIEKLRFDHHQLGGAGERENGIPYASSGLIWKTFGEELAGGREEAEVVDEVLIRSVDALDNGIDLYTLNFEDVSPYTLGDFFESFAKGAHTLESADVAFFEALESAKRLLEREINSARRRVADWGQVREIYRQAADKRVIVLPTYLSSSKVLVPSEALFVVYPRTDGKWGAQAILKKFNSFERKKYFPESWAGLSDGELAKVSGVPDAFFCHRHRHLAGADTQEGAVKLAQIALNS